MNNRRIKKLLFVLLVALCAVLCACTVQHADSEPEIDPDNSYFLDFTVEGETVVIRGHYVIWNRTDRARTVQLRGDFAKDKVLGLVKESTLLAADAETGDTAFALAPGKTELDVVFIGTFAGTEQKADRLLPETDILPQ